MSSAIQEEMEFNLQMFEDVNICIGCNQHKENIPCYDKKECEKIWLQ